MMNTILLLSSVGTALWPSPRPNGLLGECTWLRYRPASPVFVDVHTPRLEARTYVILELRYARFWLRRVAGSSPGGHFDPNARGAMPPFSSLQAPIPRSKKALAGRTQVRCHVTISSSVFPVDQCPQRQTHVPQD